MLLLRVLFLQALPPRPEGILAAETTALSWFYLKLHGVEEILVNRVTTGEFLRLSERLRREGNAFPG